jgi:molecular chaperone HscB
MRTFFDVLGVPRAFHLDGRELEARYLALSRELHPDRHVRKTPRERLLAVTRTTELNDAYRALKRDIPRAEYLLKLEGLDVADEKSSSVKTDRALLMDMMELNEQLSEAQASGDAAAVAALTRRVEADRAAALARVDAGFAAFERGDRAQLLEIAQALIALRYHGRLLARVAGEEA